MLLWFAIRWNFKVLVQGLNVVNSVLLITKNMKSERTLCSRVIILPAQKTVNEYLRWPVFKTSNV